MNNEQGPDEDTDRGDEEQRPDEDRDKGDEDQSPDEDTDKGVKRCPTSERSGMIWTRYENRWGTSLTELRVCSGVLLSS